MFDRGQEFILKVEERQLFFNEHDFLPVEQVFLDHSEERGMEIESFAFSQFPWIKVWVQKFADGVLDCDVSDFKPASSGFQNQGANLSNVRKLLLFVDSGKVLEFAHAKPKPKQKPVVRKPQQTTPRSLPHLKSILPPVSKQEPFDETVHFKIPLEQIRFAKGCAEVQWSGHLPKSCKHVRLDMSIKNRFLSERLNCIKPYLSKCLNRDKVKVSSTVRVHGEEITVMTVASDTIASISPELIGEVRFHYAKGELRNWHRREERMITAEDFFQSIKDAGFGDSDSDFLADILRVKQPKHAEHIEYLAGLHRSDLIRLRIVRTPFSFLCFLTGKSGGYFVWETLDGSDATYVWKLPQPMEYYLADHRKELRRGLDWVEQNLDCIHASGRNEYLGERRENFVRIFHDYQDEEGFKRWKQEIGHLLDHGIEKRICDSD
ncbi:hypothetical protein P4C99_09620 [Pontiellaceae bacterium B1224]|nr:hypothetical protein [Pontiellaceae bacterium B1224]